MIRILLAEDEEAMCTYLARALDQASADVSERGEPWIAARLAALRMQLSPHTLFNLLHTIRGAGYVLREE